MKRGIITNKGLGIHISDGEVWMTTWELADLFYTTAGAIHAAIKRILKTNILKSHEVCKYIKLENGNNADVYNLDMVVALSYQIDTVVVVRHIQMAVGEIEGGHLRSDVLLDRKSVV